MKILVIGGTRFFGIHMVNELLEKGHDVTIATRGISSDEYGDKVKRIILERTNEESVKEALSGVHYDVVIDKIAYCSNDIKYVMEAVDCDKYMYMSERLENVCNRCAFRLFRFYYTRFRAQSQGKLKTKIVRGKCAEAFVAAFVKL